ncbi:hypothetical protein [Methanococcoides methylutens]|nr:hypothetical protein [Methanococcoides methylutens]
MAEIDGVTDNIATNWISTDKLVPEYLTNHPVCPSKGRYFLVRDESGYFVPICSYHSTDRDLINSMIIDAYLKRLLTYKGMEFIMGAQGKRTRIDDLLHIIYNKGFEKGWEVWTKENAIDCSALAIESMRDALEEIYHNSTLIPDTTALNLGKVEGKYPYTKQIKTSVKPSDMADPCSELKPGDMCIITGSSPHTTIFLGRFREKEGDNNPYWIWASGSKGKVDIFTHERFQYFYKRSKQVVSRWDLKKYRQ